MPIVLNCTQNTTPNITDWHQNPSLTNTTGQFQTSILTNQSQGKLSPLVEIWQIRPWIWPEKTTSLEQEWYEKYTRTCHCHNFSRAEFEKCLARGLHPLPKLCPSWLEAAQSLSPPPFTDWPLSALSSGQREPIKLMISREWLACCSLQAGQSLMTNQDEFHYFQLLIVCLCGCTEICHIQPEIWYITMNKHHNFWRSRFLMNFSRILCFCIRAQPHFDKYSTYFNTDVIKTGMEHLWCWQLPGHKQCSAPRFLSPGSFHLCWRMLSSLSDKLETKFPLR